MSGRLVDMLLPPRCFDCGAGVAEQGDLCADCWGALTFISAPQCALCGYPFEYAADDYNRGDELCGSCLRRRPVFDTARAVLRYDDASRHLILGFKYRDHTAGTRAFGRWLGRLAGQLDTGEMLIMPVPLHPRRLWRRRYNQSALIAAAMGRETGIAVNLLDLVRHRDTPSQGGLNARQRFRNMRAAFSLRQRPGEIVAGRHILLIDDVLTTGATAEACSRVLKRGGAARISLLALARVVRPASGAI
jgi:ComF family protein